ncbi:MAG: hypothetical protein QM719_05770 [Thermomonas sp.]
MRFFIEPSLASLAQYIPRFFTLVGEERWFKCVDQLNNAQLRSPFIRKIVSDYHWLEMALSYQSEILKHEGSLNVAHIDTPSRVALQFAGAVVEIHNRLGPRGRHTLEGRLIGATRAETGFAALFLELDLACRLMDAGYDVDFPDLEGTDQYDLVFRRGDVVCEIECKSLSADAGRKIHRKDFYRFMEAIRPALTHRVGHFDVLVVSLRDRLSSTLVDQRQLREDVIETLQGKAPSEIVRADYRLERNGFSERLPNLKFGDEQAVYKECTNAFGPNLHISGTSASDGGCLLVMRSEKEDDTSKPLLEAMRKASSQFSGNRPCFIAIQFQEIKPGELMLYHLRRRAGILSYALFGQYGGSHVNSTYFCGYGAVIQRGNLLATPGFSIPNPQPRFQISLDDAAPFLIGLTDEEYAIALGEPLPTANTSHLLF